MNKDIDNDIDKKADKQIDDNVDNEINGSLDNETTNEIDSKVAIELEQLEKEMGTKISELPEPPLNQEFQKSMRNTILDASCKEQSKNMNYNIENDSINNEHITNGNIENENIVKERVKERINEEINKSNRSNRRGLFSTIKNSFINSRNFKIAASFLIIAFVFGGLFWGLGRLNSVVQPVIASELDIKALQEDKLGVDTESAFLLTCENPLDEKTVKENLKVEPAFEYNLEKRDEGKEYRIVPSIKLASNTVYSISFDPTGKERESCSWAFQTKSSFRVLGSLPRNEATNVPIDTGLEITFSHDNFQIDRVKKYFSISPQVEGYFEKHKKTLVFVSDGLKQGTIYTVTLKKGLPLEESTETLGEEYTFSFETKQVQEKTDKFSFEIDTSMIEFSTSEVPVYPLHLSHSSSEQEVYTASVSLYRYSDYKDFIEMQREKDEVPEWSFNAKKEYKEDFNILTKTEEFKSELFGIYDYNHKTYYLTFPHKLPAGYYTATIKVNDAVRQIWFQATDLAVYQAQGREKSLFWVNDLETKKPAKGVSLIVEGGKLSFKGNEQGVISVDKNIGSKEAIGTQGKGYAVIKNDMKEIVVPLISSNNISTSKNLDRRDYWKYLYLDRELFKPGDIVNYWGILSPRKGASEINELEVEIRGTGGNYSYGWGEKAPIISQKASVNNKVFTGSIELPILSPGYYYIEVKKENTVFLSRGFSVENYQKPAYKISVKAEKKATFVGEKVNFHAKASFFEGTPVNNVKLNCNISGQRNEIVTNEKGTATFSYTASESKYSHDPYRKVYLGMNAAFPETGEISTSNSILVFRSNVYMESKIATEGDKFTLDAKLSKIDLTKINEGKSPYDKNNFIGKPAGNCLIKGSIYQEIWEKEEYGSSYNFITKKVEKTYRYNDLTKHIEDFEMVTGVDGKAVYKGTFDKGNSYYVILVFQDGKGCKIEKKLRISNSGYCNDSNFKGYKYYDLEIEQEGKSFALGESVSLTLMENDKNSPFRNQGYLFYQGQKEIETYSVLDESEYRVTFKEENIPNLNVVAVYFDGVKYHEVDSYRIPFDKEQKALKINIKADKVEYRPKDKVKLEVLVTDKNGKPVKAKVNLNLVDEALYSMRDQNVDFISKLYSDYLYLYTWTRNSHRIPYDGYIWDGAECGGEGESERKDFSDTVIFRTVETDSNGKATTEFTLPDNLTSWRVTYHGVTQDLQAASGSSQIAVRLPFFVEMVVNDNYLAGDKPVITLRSFGEKVRPGTSVAYNMELITPSGEKVEQKGESVFGDTLDWQLPALEEGKYALVVGGKAGGFSDKLRKEFTVVDSFLERTVTTHQLLQENIKLEGSAKEPTMLVFSDYEKSQYLRGLYRLAWRNGGRLEQKLASQEARKLLNEYFNGNGNDNSKGYSVGNEEFFAYQQNDGGISILPYAESEPALTALVASLKCNDFDTRAMAGYFYNLLEKGADKGEDVTLSLWGLGALGEPVLLEINSYLTKDDLSPEEKIHLAMAVLDIGNGAYAKQVYQELLDKYGENLGNSIRINIGEDQDEIVTATTQMALLAAKLGTVEKNRLYQYILENPGKEMLNSLEQLQILKYNLRFMDSKPVSFTYELNGKKEKKSLKGRETFTMYVLPEDIEKVKFSAIEGEIGVMTLYNQPYQEEDVAVRDDLQIKRKYQSNSVADNTFKRGDLIEVVLNYEIKDKAPRGTYEIVDVLPAGLRYVNRPYSRGSVSNYWRYPSSVNGQKISFNVWKGSYKIIYYARVVSPGEFMAQGTLLSHVKNNDICVLGKNDRVDIK